MTISGTRSKHRAQTRDGSMSLLVAAGLPPWGLSGSDTQQGSGPGPGADRPSFDPPSGGARDAVGDARAMRSRPPLDTGELGSSSGWTDIGRRCTAEASSGLPAGGPEDDKAAPAAEARGLTAVVNEAVPTARGGCSVGADGSSSPPL